MSTKRQCQSCQHSCQTVARCWCGNLVCPECRLEGDHADCFEENVDAVIATAALKADAARKACRAAPITRKRGRMLATTSLQEYLRKLDGFPRRPSLITRH